MIVFALTLLLAFTPVRSANHNHNVNIEMNLGFQPNDLLLNITIFNKQVSKTWIEFKQSLVYCLQSDNTDNESLQSVNNKTIGIYKNGEQKGQYVVYLYFVVAVEAEGYVQCYCNNSEHKIQSNILFYRFDNNVFVMQLSSKDSSTKIKQESKEVIAKNVERIVGLINFSVSLKVENTIHLTSSTKTITPKSDSEILKQLQEIVDTKIKKKYDVNYVRSTRYCPERNETNIFYLPQTPRGYSAKMLPIGQNNFQSYVSCVGNFYQGVYWNENDIGKILNSSIIEPISSAIKLNPLDITSPLDTSYEIQDFADKLSTLQNFSASEIPELTSKMNQLLSANFTLFQELRNSNISTSNQILASLDHILVNAAGLQGNGFEESVRPHFAARVEDLQVTGSQGVVVLDSDSALLSNDSLVAITSNMSNGNVLDLAPRAALRLPVSLLKLDEARGRLALAVFPSGALFSSLPTSCVVSASLGGRAFRDLAEPVRIWFQRDTTQHPDPGLCVSWDFSLNDGRGNWSSLGCRLLAVHENASWSRHRVVLDECGCWHLTHFGELFWPRDGPMTEDVPHAEALDLITLAGCVLSLAGLSGVFATAIFAQGWIKGSGHKIQLQISINLAILITLFLIITNTEFTNSLCIFMGILLHYSMLSNFCWMLLAAYLQYTRLVKVVTSRQSRLPLKTGLVGWVLPVIPCFLILISGQYQVYSEPPLCLPRAFPFYTTILAPLAAIMCFNIAIFVMIARNLYGNIAIRRHEKNCFSLLRFKQLVFLFVLLGLSWVFALCQLVFPQSWALLFSYLFCICMALQGLTYFVFFVLMDESATNVWRNRFCPRQSRYDVKRYTTNSRIASCSGSHGATDIGTKPL